LSTHALSASDLVVLALALPIFVAAGLPLLGWGAATIAWVAAKGIEAYAQRRARASGDRRVAMGARAATLIGRLYLVGLTVLAAGIIDREAGLTAGILSVAVFTVYFATLFIVKPLEEARRA
jgi:hypothetical protein